jgi:fatty acid synthase subunit beta
VTARPFELTKEYFEDVYRLTNSPRNGHIIANWDKYENSGEVRSAAPAA